MADTPTPIAEIDHGPSKLDQFLENNQKKLLILAFVIFLGVLAYVFLKGYNDLQNENAGAMLTEASNEDEYSQVISQYSDRASAATAAYQIATTRTADADAIEAYNHFISTYPDHAWVALAEFNLAQRQINTDKIAEATATLENILDRDNADYIIPKATISLADIALANGEKEKAEQLYNDALNFNEAQHQFANEAKRKIDYLHASKPTMVEAPAPTPALPTPALPAPAAPTVEDLGLPSFPTTPAVPETPTAPATPLEQP